MLSSQRAEVTQSKLKRGLSANTRVVDLLYHIDDKNENSASRSKVFEIRLHTKNTSDSSHSLNVIRLLQQVLTPYAFSLVLDQEKQSTHYWSTSCSDPRETHESDDEGHDAPTYHPLEVDDEGVLHGLLPAAGEPQHAVIRHPTAPQQVDVALEYDDDGCVINFAEATETSPMSSRRTTPTWCSCMFFICMGGLPGQSGQVDGSSGSKEEEEPGESGAVEVSGGLVEEREGCGCCGGVGGLVEEKEGCGCWEGMWCVGRDVGVLE